MAKLWSRLSYYSQGIVLIMVSILFFVWGVFGATTVSRQNTAILEGIKGQHKEEQSTIVQNQQVIIAGTRLTVCLLEYKPEERSSKVFQRCRRQSGWDKIDKAEVLGTTVARTPLQVINRHRARHGCPPLKKASPALKDSALRWSRKMARDGHLSHSNLVLGSWSKVGEVLGVGQTWRSIVRALFKSKPHRKILLDCAYDQIALGIIYRDFVWLTGRLYAK